MRITIGKFDENGEVVWYDVESDDCIKNASKTMAEENNFDTKEVSD